MSLKYHMKIMHLALGSLKKHLVEHICSERAMDNAHSLLKWLYQVRKIIGHGLYQFYLCFYNISIIFWKHYFPPFLYW